MSEQAMTSEIVQLMNGRAQTYGLLARLYRVEVDQQFFDELRNMRFPANTGNPHVDKGYELLYKYLKQGWKDSVLDLARDYVRTFFGHGQNGRSAAYPYESVHTSEKRLMMQEARAEVLATYRANDLKKDAEWRECEDHIAVELEFMQIMSLRTGSALAAGCEDAAIEMLKVQQSFLHEHLLNWVPMLAADMLHYAETEIYRGLAELTLGFVQTEAETLEDLLRDVEK